MFNKNQNSLSTLILALLMYMSGNLIRINTKAQLIPDHSLGTEKTIINEVRPNLNQVDGGAVRGNNLFHSFQEFNIGSNQTLQFSNPQTIDRIITRVTGNNISEILGTLRVTGNADLFLINPQGIYFGNNARLELNGSFFGSTANSIVFPNDWEFSATNPEEPPLLTINIPLGLRFINNPTPINIASQPLRIKGGLLGGEINFLGSRVITENGNLEIASLGENSFVGLNKSDLGWNLVVYFM